MGKHQHGRKPFLEHVNALQSKLRVKHDTWSKQVDELVAHWPKRYEEVQWYSSPVLSSDRNTFLPEKNWILEKLVTGSQTSIKKIYK